MAYTMREAIDRADLASLGALLHEAFVAKKQMNPHIAEDTPIDAMLTAAREAGAYGGKVCGAGGGGYLLIAGPPPAHPAIRAALEALEGQFASFAFRSGGVRATRGSDVWAPST
jgi:D-glycero-alpha-D-manno-heptose-7-phosphate kinase